MKERFYILFNAIFIFFMLQNIISFGQQKTVLAQSKTGLGEGIVVITLYSADSQNYKHIDTTTVPNFKLKTAYFIKGNMILRPYMKGNMFLLEGEDLSVPKDTVYKKENLGEAELKTSLSAWISNPKYLIDWKRKKYYTFFSKDKKPHASVYSESEQHFEFFYTIRKPDTTSFKYYHLMKRNHL